MDTVAAEAGAVECFGLHFESDEARRAYFLEKMRAKLKDPEGGYDPLLAARLRAVLPACRARKIRIVTNMGAANPEAAARKAARPR